MVNRRGTEADQQRATHQCGPGGGRGLAEAFLRHRIGCARHGLRTNRAGRQRKPRLWAGLRTISSDLNLRRPLSGRFATNEPPRCPGCDRRRRKITLVAPEVGSLHCAPQQCGYGRAVCFLGRFLPKLGGAESAAIFLCSPGASRRAQQPSAPSEVCITSFLSMPNIIHPPTVDCDYLGRHKP